MNVEGASHDAYLSLALQVLNKLSIILIDLTFSMQIPMVMGYCPESCIYQTWHMDCGGTSPLKKFKASHFLSKKLKWATHEGETDDSSPERMPSLAHSAAGVHSQTQSHTQSKHVGSNDMSYLNHIVIAHYDISYRCGKCLKLAFKSGQQLKVYKKVCEGFKKKTADKPASSSMNIMNHSYSTPKKKKPVFTSLGRMGTLLHSPCPMSLPPKSKYMNYSRQLMSMGDQTYSWHTPKIP